MNNWITDRKPTAEDADRNGYVWCTDTQSEVFVTHWGSFSFDSSIAWRHRTLPLPYVPPKRQEWKHSQGHFMSPKISREVLPGDPPDLDEFLEAFDEWSRAFHAGGMSTSRMMKARGNSND